MKRTLKIVFLTTLVISLFMTSLANAAEPTVTVDPAAPVPLGEVNFTATIDDENVLGVYIETRECDELMCYPWTLQVINMTEQTDGTYTGKTNLVLAQNPYYFQYTLFVNTNEGLMEYLTDTKVYLDVDSNGNGSTNGGDNGTPGFEIISLLVAISIGVLLLRRKR